MESAGAPLVNRLSGETSPYLLQHAENPVHWQPWDDAAFISAGEMDRPVFLSIGYSTCHWCHVMEEESFQDTAVAGLMNSVFVCIKVDREERPDVDNVYMRYAVAMTGSGGWPLNIIMTPDGKPFYAATYIPRESRYGRRGMLDLVPLIEDAWVKRREEVASSAESVSSALFGVLPATSVDTDGEDPAGLCFSHLQKFYDAERGGFGGAPKFPVPHNILFLLRHWKYTEEGEALEMAARTLAAMRYGGIWDQLGGGIHRYSTDREWHVPHFEKMLHDQGLAALACLETFQATGHALYASMAGDLLDFVTGWMRSPRGGFYSALDADSHEGEGACYTWSIRELESLLGPDRASKLADMWCMIEDGNPGGPPGGAGGRKIPRLRLPPPGESLPDSPPGPDAETAGRLLEHRGQRPSPFLDTKILADWNGMTAAALARGSLVLDRPDLLAAGEQCMSFIRENMITGGGELLHSWISGEAGGRGFLDDYAFIVWACIELHSATIDRRYVDLALRLQSVQDRLFRDPAAGVYFFSAGGDDAVALPRTVETLDGAVPSGNSITMMNLYRLWGVTADGSLRRKADSLAVSLAGRAAASPASHAMLAAAVSYLPRHAGVTVRGDPSDPSFMQMVKAAFDVYSPDVTISASFAEGPASASVCAAGACMPPADSPSGLKDLLRGTGPQT